MKDTIQSYIDFVKKSYPKGYGRGITIISKNVFLSALKEKRFYLAALYFILIPIVLEIFSGAPVVQSGTGIAIYYAQVSLLVAFKSYFLSFFLGQILLVILAADLIAGEMEQNTFTLLKTKPIYDSEIVLGKFIGSMSIIALLDFPAIVFVYFKYLVALEATWPQAFFGTLDEILAAIFIVVLLQSIVIAITIFFSTIFGKSLYAILAAMLSLFVLSTASDIIASDPTNEYNWVSFSWLIDAILPKVFYNLEPLNVALPNLAEFILGLLIIPAVLLLISIIIMRNKESI